MSFFKVLVTHNEAGVNKDIYVEAATAAQAEVDAVQAAAGDNTFFGATSQPNDYTSLSVEGL